MNVGNIRLFRKEKGITQEELAKRIGVKRSVISKYENGSVEPSLKQLKKIADALEVPMGLLIRKEESMDSETSADTELRGRLVDLDWLVEQEQAEYLRVQGEENLWIRLLNEAVHQRFQRILSEIPIAK